jgi:hypothetical protein
MRQVLAVVQNASFTNRFVHLPVSSMAPGIIGNTFTT